MKNKTCIILSLLFWTILVFSQNNNSDPISVTYYEKDGSRFTEIFSLKNNTSEEIIYVKIRFVYISDNNEEINYQDIDLNTSIAPYKSKQYTIDSFDQNQTFAYKNGKTYYKKAYSLFDIEYEILDYKTRATNRENTSRRSVNNSNSSTVNTSSKRNNSYENENNQSRSSRSNDNSGNADRYLNSYVGCTTQEANFRTYPSDHSSESRVLKKLSAGTSLLILSKDTQNGYYNCVDIDTGTEGYVYANFVQIVEKVNVQNGNIFTPTGKISQHNSTIEIFNNTNRKMTLEIGYYKYEFASQETKNISIPPGNYAIMAYSSGVIPFIGKDALSPNSSYSWTFYIVSVKQ